MAKIDIGTILNAYPDSIGGKLSDIISLLRKDEFKDAFKSFYILPSIFNSDLDRGFSLIDYSLNKEFASQKDIDDLHKLNIDLLLDFILNHISVLSKQFQDIIQNGELSKYKDFFINWNEFWKGYGEMNIEGYIVPEEKYIKDMFFRKAGMPILMVRFPDGKEVPYWNTFYQEVIYNKVDSLDLIKELSIEHGVADEICELVNKFVDEKKKINELDLGKYNEYLDKIKDYLNFHRSYLGQMDLNIKSDLVWQYYEETSIEAAAECFETDFHGEVRPRAR